MSKLHSGTRIRFCKAINSYGEVMAPKNGLGTIRVIGGTPGGKWGFLVAPDCNPQNSFGCAREEFEVVEE
jgi:hypothetical protein